MNPDNPKLSIFSDAPFLATILHAIPDVVLLIDVARWQERRSERAVPYENVCRKLRKAGRL